jgi:hypothetical protein
VVGGLHAGHRPQAEEVGRVDFSLTACPVTFFISQNIFLFTPHKLQQVQTS